MNSERMFDFPYEPYPIQLQLMRAIYDAIDQKKVAIMESPTGTGKSLSAICAALTWLEHEEKRRVNEIMQRRSELETQLKEVNEADDWMGVSQQKLLLEQGLEAVGDEENRKQKVANRLEQSRQRVKLVDRMNKTSGSTFPSFSLSEKKQKRRLENNENEEDFDRQIEGGDFSNSGANENDDLLPSDTEENDGEANKLHGKEEKDDHPLECLKIVYASRTHTQLEQFVHELYKTRFRPRVVSVGGRQQLCINDAVRALGSATLVNDRCNQLLDGKLAPATGKRQKGIDGTTKKTRCGCAFARASAIETLSDHILADSSSEYGPLSSMVAAGRDHDACPYFSARSALGLCQLVLVPYNVLLHQPTREAWQLGLKDAVVIVDEAHNLLQTLASIHSCQLDVTQVHRCSSLLHDYIDRFRNRLSPRNFLHIRQLQTVVEALKRLPLTLAAAGGPSSPCEMVFSTAQFLTKLNFSCEINLFLLLDYVERAKLCRKLRDFGTRASNTALVGTHKLQQKTAEETAENLVQNQPKTLDQLMAGIAPTKEKTANKREKTNKGKSGQNPRKNGQSEIIAMPLPEKEKVRGEGSQQEVNGGVPSAPFYQLVEFLLALVSSSSDDTRVLVTTTIVGGSEQLETSFRLVHLNPMDKLKDLVTGTSGGPRAILLLGGTMRPTELLHRGLTSVCALPEERIVEFSCGHVVAESNLLALSIAAGPDKTDLTMNYSSRSSPQLLASIAQLLVNMLRHIPNGVVCFFPSYAFLKAFVASIRASGHFEAINKLKQICVETQGTASSSSASPTSIWDQFCGAARADRGALLFAVVNGRLSEGINFSDELGRCVFMVGMPYPNRHSAELSEQIKYVSDRMGGPSAGHRYYETLCMQSVNQAIGRVIRHREDYAAIVLLDARYGRPAVVEALPGWIRDRLAHCPHFPDALSRIVQFFRTKRVSS